MHFIEYFPHREIGICFYHLGQNDLAERELRLFLQQEYSSRAQDYLSKLSGTPQVKPPVQPPIRPIEDEPTLPTEIEPPITPPPPDQLKLVGERMGLAVLPFQTKGLGREMGEINVVEQMMTTFFNLNRFKLFE